MSYTIVIEGTYSRPLAGPLGWLEFKDFLDSVNDDDFVHTKELVNIGRNQALPQLRRELEELLQRNPDSAVATTIQEFIDAIDTGPFGAMLSEITRSSVEDNGEKSAAEGAPVATAADLEEMLPTEPAGVPAAAQPADDEPEEMSEGITLEHPEIPPVVHVEPRPAKPQPAAPVVTQPAAKPMKKAAKPAPAKAAPAKKPVAKSPPAKKAAAKKTIKKAAKKAVVRKAAVKKAATKKAAAKKVVVKKAVLKKAAKKTAKKVTAVKKATPTKKAAPKKAAKKAPLKKAPAKKAPAKKVAKLAKKVAKKPVKKVAKKR